MIERPRPRIRSVAILLGAATVLFLAGASGAGESARSLEIRILNDEADCGDTLELSLGNLITGCHHRAPGSGCQVTEDGRRFVLDLEEVARFHQIGRPGGEVRLLLFCPGFATETLEIELAELGHPTLWQPTLTRLPRWTVHGSAVLPGGEPVGLAVLEIRYSLLEAMTYFGYVDGFVPEIDLGEIRTAADGTFEVEIVDLRADPWIDSERRVSLVSIGPPRQDGAGWDRRIRSTSLTLRELYRPELRLAFGIRDPARE